MLIPPWVMHTMPLQAIRMGVADKYIKRGFWNNRLEIVMPRKRIHEGHRTNWQLEEHAEDTSEISPATTPAKRRGKSEAPNPPAPKQKKQASTSSQVLWKELATVKVEMDRCSSLSSSIVRSVKTDTSWANMADMEELKNIQAKVTDMEALQQRHGIWSEMASPRTSPRCARASTTGKPMSSHS